MAFQYKNRIPAVPKPEVLRTARELACNRRQEYGIRRQVYGWSQ